MAAGYESKRKRLESLRSQLEGDRSTFLSHWQDIGDNLAPRRPRFYTTDVNRGDRRNQKIIDTSPVLSARALRSGMMGGITSPARPWFDLIISDFDARDSSAVKDWLDRQTKRMRSVFSRSNLYNVLLQIYGDLGYFATAAMLVEEDYDYVIRCYPIPIGSYSIGLSEKLKVEVFFRKFQMTARQIIQKFGRQQNGSIDWTNISTSVKSAYESNKLNQMFGIIHAIIPNEYFDDTKIESKFKKFYSCYYEEGHSTSEQSQSEDIFLSEMGYDYFPVLVPRWETTGEDAWGTNCPGMEALGDVKELYLADRRLAQAVDLLVKPPMKGPTSLKTTTAAIIPGKVTYVDERGDQGSFKPVFQVDPRVDELERRNDKIRERISKAFYEDLFLMISESDRRDITAREIDERHEEKLLALGPVLEQLNQDLLDPLIEIAFNFMHHQGLIEAPPEEIAGKNIDIEYVSIMAQAQKLAGLASIDRFTQYYLQLAEVDETVKDKVDSHALLDDYADITSMGSGVIRSEKDVQARTDARAQAQASAQKAEAMQSAAKGARDLSATDLSSDNALSRMVKAAQAGSPLTPLGEAG